MRCRDRVHRQCEVLAVAIVPVRDHHLPGHQGDRRREKSLRVGRRLRGQRFAQVAGSAVGAGPLVGVPGGGDERAGREDRRLLLAGLRREGLPRVALGPALRLRRHQNGGKFSEPLPAPFGPCHGGRCEAAHDDLARLLVLEFAERPVADPGAEVGQVERVDRRRKRGYHDMPTGGAPVLVLLAVANGAGGRDPGLPGPHGLHDGVAEGAPRLGPVVEVRGGQALVPEDDVDPVAGLWDAEKHAVEVEDAVLVALDVELLEPPSVGGAVAVPLALHRRAPRGEFGGALDEDHPGVVLGGVVERAVRRGAVAL